MTIKGAACSVLSRLGALDWAQFLYAAVRDACLLGQVIENRRLRRAGAPDGWPIPPGRFIYWVSGNRDVARHFAQGRHAAEWIRKIAWRSGLALDECSILDFGCGCGRVLRQLATTPGPRLAGCDVNGRAVAWCMENLPIADYAVLDGWRLPWPDHSFDMAYALIVFTHLSESQQSLWIHELYRVLRPGGLLLLTTHGSSRIGYMPEPERAAFLAGRSVVLRRNYDGSNNCCTYHPPPAVEALAAPMFTVQEYIPDGAYDAAQDLHVLRRAG